MNPTMVFLATEPRSTRVHATRRRQLRDLGSQAHGAAAGGIHPAVPGAGAAIDGSEIWRLNNDCWRSLRIFG